MPGIDHTWYRKPRDVPSQVSCGGVVARVDLGRVLVALVREGPRSMYVLPKGRLEKGETLEQAARREIEEEAGINDLALLSKLAVLERFDYAKTSWKIIHYFLFSTRQVETRPTDATRHYIVGWFPIDALPPMFWPEQKALVETRRDDIVRQVRAAS